MSFMSRYGFLTLGIHEDFYYWEVVVMLLKTVVIFSIEVLSSISNEV